VGKAKDPERDDGKNNTRQKRAHQIEKHSYKDFYDYQIIGKFLT
jgi:hypothetical protein